MHYPTRVAIETYKVKNIVVPGLEWMSDIKEEEQEENDYLGKDYLKNEAKIQVQGIGMYDEKTLKKKITDLTKNLHTLAKKGQWSKSSENGIKALGRMWGAYQDWDRNNG